MRKYNFIADKKKKTDRGFIIWAIRSILFYLFSFTTRLGTVAFTATQVRREAYR